MMPVDSPVHKHTSRMEDLRTGLLTWSRAGAAKGKPMGIMPAPPKCEPRATAPMLRFANGSRIALGPVAEEERYRGTAPRWESR